jgi:AcrR family transcriptional regulator
MSVQRRIKSTVKSRERVWDRRAQLVEAAIRVFRDKGFHATTVREIGAAAGLTQGTIYNYVRSKDDILYLVCDSVITAYQDGVRSAIESVEGQPHRMEAALHALIGVMYEHQDDILLLYHESHALDRRSLHAILARVAEFHRFVEETLCDGLDETDPALSNRALITNIVTYLPTIVAQRRWLLDRTVPKHQVIDGLVCFMMRGLGLASGAESMAATNLAGPLQRRQQKAGPRKRARPAHLAARS